MQRTKAPASADEVGSLLRPPRIKEARAKLEKGEGTADDLRKAEDLEIEKVVHKQASLGLRTRDRREIAPAPGGISIFWPSSAAANFSIPTPAFSSRASRPAMTPSASSASLIFPTPIRCWIISGS